MFTKESLIAALEKLPDDAKIIYTATDRAENKASTYCVGFNKKQYKKEITERSPHMDKIYELNLDLEDKYHIGS